jgi:hypothetical protein
MQSNLSRELHRLHFIKTSNTDIQTSQIGIESLRYSIGRIETDLEELARNTTEREREIQKTQESLDFIFSYMSDLCKVPEGSLEADISPLTAETVEWVSKQLNQENELERLQRTLAKSIRAGFELLEKHGDEDIELIQKSSFLLRQFEHEGFDKCDTDSLRGDHAKSLIVYDELKEILACLKPIQ